ncbi:hypothetical protein [Sphingomonas sp. TREG-RG-20F-R18-01]|uniref:hypothetical protein n=1 Tax=Sphingomonas sp. TREG-RG-20F-R18-01 TaxID=2914982 RepID=UPI001F573C35|nr:hypothetical protein [Sphingomonas sp. TREG-RG-20F-R18-01]
MTAPPEFGAAIEVNGERPSWLPDDIWIQRQEHNDPHWYGLFRGGFEASNMYWKPITAIRLEVPRYDFVYLALERGMVPEMGAEQ